MACLSGCRLLRPGSTTRGCWGSPSHSRQYDPQDDLIPTHTSGTRVQERLMNDKSYLHEYVDVILHGRAGSWPNSRIITTLIAFIAHSPAPHQHSAPARHPL